ncbi:MAG: S-layer homology domain-containing protein, partial [Syntrophomonadaceae bacterium]|nr:S-layer homology domain-containing protein [Syntrophomonadaceae bacterium]
MQLKKRSSRRFSLIALAAAAAMLLAGWSGGVLAARPGTSDYVFSDLKGHWAAKEMQELAFMGFLRGDGTGRLRPDQPVTRAEFTCLLVRVQELAPSPEQVLPVDVSPQSWYHGEIQSAFRNGLAAGRPDGLFYPEQGLTRAEAAALLVRGLQGQPAEDDSSGWEGADQAGSSSYRDVAPGFWALPCIEEGRAKGIISGFPDQTFRPNKETTRAEAAVLIYRLLQLLEPEKPADLVKTVIAGEKEAVKAV